MIRVTRLAPFGARVGDIKVDADNKAVDINAKAEAACIRRAVQSSSGLPRAIMRQSDNPSAFALFQLTVTVFEPFVNPEPSVIYPRSAMRSRATDMTERS